MKITKRKTLPFISLHSFPSPHEQDIAFIIVFYVCSNLEKHLVMHAAHLQYLIHLSPPWHFSLFFTASQYRSKILTQVLFNFFYIGFMQLSWNTISIILMTMMSTNIATDFVTLTKTFSNDNNNSISHFTYAALILALIALFHKSWSVL